MKNYTLLSLILFIFSEMHGQNPISPAGQYIADPTARVWNDGKLYIYGSRDENPAYYGSWHHDMLSTSDMKTWTLTKNIFASKGENDQIPYSDKPLYAPDILHKDGTYYYYYCMPEAKNVEGVATSKSPLGPFTNAQNIDLNGVYQIDPAVFTDDDGQVYYLWGQFAAKIAKLKPNLKEIDFSTFKDSIITEKEHKFHEGSFMIKRKGIYYLIYTDISRAGRATCIGYATANSPYGPFKYRGVIIDNDHCDPLTWNNHGSVVEFKNQWYIFYHRSTHGSITTRKACVEPIKFNADGTIDEVEMTTQGAGEPLNALEQIDAERACLLYGNARVEVYNTDNEILTKFQKDDKAAYKYINFGNGVDSITLNVAAGQKGGVIDIALDNSWSASVGSVKIPDNGDGKTWTQFTAPVKNVKGVRTVWLRFNTEGGDTFKVDWFKFSKKQ
jgi:arabinoxylan arabinofuranohydrolase